MYGEKKASPRRVVGPTGAEQAASKMQSVELQRIVAGLRAGQTVTTSDGRVFYPSAEVGAQATGQPVEHFRRLWFGGYIYHAPPSAPGVRSPVNRVVPADIASDISESVRTTSIQAGPTASRSRTMLLLGGGAAILGVTGIGLITYLLYSRRKRNQRGFA